MPLRVGELKEGHEVNGFIMLVLSLKNSHVSVYCSFRGSFFRCCLSLWNLRQVEKFIASEFPKSIYDFFQF